MAKWIRFEFIGLSPSGKTKIWEIRTKLTDFVIGWIKWDNIFRKYSLFPANDTSFENDCLRDIIDFNKQQNDLHKAIKSEVKNG